LQPEAAATASRLSHGSVLTGWSRVTVSRRDRDSTSESGGPPAAVTRSAVRMAGGGPGPCPGLRPPGSSAPGPACGRVRRRPACAFKLSLSAAAGGGSLAAAAPPGRFGLQVCTMREGCHPSRRLRVGTRLGAWPGAALLVVLATTQAAGAGPTHSLAGAPPTRTGPGSRPATMITGTPP
jgi:hypothetical protein